MLLTRDPAGSRPDPLNSAAIHSTALRYVPSGRFVYVLIKTDGVAGFDHTAPHKRVISTEKNRTMCGFSSGVMDLGLIFFPSFIKGRHRF